MSDGDGFGTLFSSRVARVVLAVVVGLALVLLLFAGEHERAQRGRLIHSDWVLNLLWLVAPVVLLVKGRELWKAGGEARDPALASGVILFCFMVLFLFSGAVKHPWFYFLNWYPVNDPGSSWLDAGVVRLVLLTSLLLPFFVVRRQKMWLVALGILVVSQVVCFAFLLRVTGGAALYNDDHPSFMFRLWEFGQTFPGLVSYNPYWNGGVVNFVGTTSGTAVLGIPFYPLWRFVPPHAVYTCVIGLVYIVIMPWLAVASLRIVGAGRTAAFCAGILALGVSQHFFLWMLHYGTVGAEFCSSFVVPFSACVYRVVWLRKREKWLFAALVLSAFFLLQWPPGAMMAVPVALSTVLSAKRWRVRSLVFLIVAGLVVGLLCLRPFLTIVLHGDSLMGHVLHAGGGGAFLSPEAVVRGWKYLFGSVHEGHPVLIFLGIGGIFVLPYRRLRGWYWPVLLFFALTAGWGREIKPNMQLGRMSITLFFAAVVPASLLSARLLRSGDIRLSLVRAGLISLLVLGGWNVAQIYANRGRANYTVLSPCFRDFVEWIRKHTPQDGRVLFAGRTSHLYGRGHTAYLAHLTGREMMACDYYEFPLGTIERNYPPLQFRKPESGLFDFMNLYNVVHVVTYKDKWKSAFRRHPDQFEEVWSFDVPEDVTVSIFRVIRESTMFLKGSGEVGADFNRLAIRLDEPSSDVVLKYNWSDRLSAPDPVELYRWDAGRDVSLIGIRANGKAEFDISFRSAL